MWYLVTLSIIIYWGILMILFGIPTLDDEAKHRIIKGSKLK